MIVNDDSPYPANGLKARGGQREEHTQIRLGVLYHKLQLLGWNGVVHQPPRQPWGRCAYPRKRPGRIYGFSLTYGEGTVARDSACSPIRISSPPLSIRLIPYGYGRVDCKRGGILHRKRPHHEGEESSSRENHGAQIPLATDVDDWGLLLPPEIVDMVEIGLFERPAKEPEMFLNDSPRASSCLWPTSFVTRFGTNMPER